jgi:hypothetical protein
MAGGLSDGDVSLYLAEKDGTIIVVTAIYNKS